MKRFAVLACFCASSAALAALSAPVESGLQNGDSIRCGYTAVTTVPRNYSSGGAGIYIFGRKHALGSQLAPGSAYAAEQLTAFMDYKLMIKHTDEDKVAKLELKGEGDTTYAYNESFSGAITGKELNEALVKARAACPDCANFYIAVSQDTGWGSFDLLPIRNYTGAHSLNRKPSAMSKKDPEGKNEGFTIFNSFIDYLPADH